MQLEHALGILVPSRETKYNDVLPASITKAASKQTFYTVGFLVDRDRRADAYRAYAYFRWVDDWLDQNVSDKLDRVAFVERQEALVDSCYGGKYPIDTTPEERMIVELIRNDGDQNGGLESYIRNMLAVMALDANRQGKLVSEDELTQYSRHLGIAVTEALHYFIGHDDATPHNETRYLSAIAAHITHMLRDAWEDAEAGYYNIPSNLVESAGIDPCDLWSEPYRDWVRSRVDLAREYFKAGKRYLAQVKNFRCRLAGYAYIARFEGVLTTIELDGYRLRSEYLERKRLTSILRMVWSTVASALGLAARG